MQRKQKNYFSILIIVLFLLLSACASYKPIKKQELPLNNVKLKNYLSPWWQIFQDKELNTTMQKMFQNNLDLLSARSRILQADYLVTKTNASRSPQIDLSLGASHTQNHFPEETITENKTSASLQASYEVDLFGRLQNLTQASQLESKQKRFDYETMAVRLSAEMAINYYSAIQTKESMQTLQKRIKLAQNEIILLQKRYATNNAKLVDILGQKSAYKQMQTDYETLRYQQTLYKGAVAALLGVKPQTLQIFSKKLPQIQIKPLVPLPSEILLKRPDIQAAYASLMALDKRAAAAVWAQYPRFILTASLSQNDIRLNNLFNLWYALVSASLTTPLFDAGNTKADAKLALEKRKESLLQLKQLLINAAIEVHNAIVLVDTRQKRITFIEKQLFFNQQKMRLYQNGYIHATESFKLYLDAKLSYLSTQLQEIQARYDLIESYITLYRTTASAWQNKNITKAKQ